MARNVRLVIVCEDILHETFIRAFLKKRGFTPRQLTFRTSPRGAGDAKQFVCEKTCEELKALRRFRRPGHGLLYVMDADTLTVEERRRTLEKACQDAKIEPPQNDDRVFGIVPKWEIENWLAYLRGEEVDERSNKYDKYQKCESKIYPLVERLADNCAQQQELPQAPPSLVDACVVYGKFAQWQKKS